MIKWLKRISQCILRTCSDQDTISLGIGDIDPRCQPEGTPSIWRKPIETRPPEAHPHNAPGPFYSENDGCITCGAPKAEAPDLVTWHEVRYGTTTYSHCIFYRQPETPEELDRAIGAMHISCVENLRYRGTDAAILKRLSAMGMAHLCDTLENV